MVPKKEGTIRKVNDIETIVKHSKVKFLDNNILAYPGHLSILQELIDKNIRCSFNQGLDIQLLTKKNSILLSKMKYLNEYLFAFDSWKYKNIVENKMNLLSWAKKWKLRFFVYINPNTPIQDIVKRIIWLKENKCLPYVMRDISCWNSKHNNFYIDIASYANQVHFFKKITFSEFLIKRHNRGKYFTAQNIDRINNSLIAWNR